ncbi:MAG: hypothetical protein PHX47_01975 [Candidatus ainarchaeum sp.]|nr:hypothetical protein [Candidatus ainarchaeum sp.]
MLKKSISKVRSSIKKINPFKREKSVYEKLNERYRDVRYEYFPEKPSFKELNDAINKDKIVTFLTDKKRTTIVGESKYISFLSYIERDGIHFSRGTFKTKGKNSFRNLYDIKKYADFLVRFSKKNRIKEIRTETWLFEEFKGFAKYIGGFKLEKTPANLNRINKYREALLKNNVKKVVSFNFERNQLKCFTKEGKEISLKLELPSYVLKV